MLKVILLPICGSLIISLCFQKNNGLGYAPFTALRRAVLESLIITAILSIIYTEFFSAISLINTTTAFVFWLVSAVFLAFLCYRKQTFSFPESSAKLIDTILLKSLDTKYRLSALVLLLVIILPLLVEAVYGAPNNLDSNNYHLLRIVSWLDNQNVGHFPTYHVQQLYHNVLSEYLVMQIMLLSGTDSFANLVQFVAMLGSLAAISLLGKELGFGYKAQLVCVALLLFLPIGIFESTTTQNDYVACFFFLCFLVYGYSILKGTKKTKAIVFMALSLALGGFTKYPVLIYALPFCLYFGYRILVQFGYSVALRTLVTSVLCLILIFTPFCYRNFQLFGNPLAPPSRNPLNNESIPSQKHSAAHTLATLTKNLAIHLGLPNDGYNKKVDGYIEAFQRSMNVDPNDPATNNNRYYTRFVIHEDYVPNTLHFLLLLLVLPLIFWKSKNTEIKILAVLAILGILLFSTLLKYQPFSSRTQMPFFAIGCVLTAHAFSDLFKVKPIFLILPFFLTSLFFVYGNPGKTLIPFRYYFKLALGHLPRDVCPTPAETAAYRKLLADYYDFSEKAKCFPLKSWPGYRERIEILGRLDNLGFTKKDKAYGLFSTTRVQNSYLNHPQDYDQIMKLLPHFPEDGGNIGIIYGKGTGYYHHLQTMTTLLKKPFTTRCVYYKKEYQGLKNAKRDFNYRYILSDSLNLVQHTIDPFLVDSVFKTEGIVLVRLKKISDRRYLY